MQSVNISSSVIAVAGAEGDEVALCASHSSPSSSLTPPPLSYDKRRSGNQEETPGDVGTDGEGRVKGGARFSAVSPPHSA